MNKKSIIVLFILLCFQSAVFAEGSHRILVSAFSIGPETRISFIPIGLNLSYDFAPNFGPLYAGMGGSYNWAGSGVAHINAHAGYRIENLFVELSTSFTSVWHSQVSYLDYTYVAINAKIGCVLWDWLYVKAGFAPAVYFLNDSLDTNRGWSTPFASDYTTIDDYLKFYTLDIGIVFTLPTDVK